ncbi:MULTISPECIES: FixH family protein [Paenibacillus]|uniref:YtkA-like domain-containing protein n=1 Tax=Paenibacillus campinasensis TaxID=66347 RepID=A0A268F2L3_9BACL|nr:MULTISPECIES: FixH family protein [Paenibacillus]MUG65925.1 hypothetical protein [Paenibacillus campinasensis]PAD79610.1 hypothetical protein CHH67_03790 [Paenibacillus campinasensis]PAK51716.1 hypothetical protein CHH75_14210 [Paenibacillus sp. 7541]
MSRKKMALFAAMVLMAVALSACSDGDAKGVDDEMMLEPILVDLTLSPDTIQVGETVAIQAKVTHGGAPVEDADKVEFEFAMQGGGLQVTVPVQHAGDGVYQMDKSFDRPGTYRVISHVTARGQHSMPLKELTVLTSDE